MTVGTTHHIALGGHEYILRPGSYIKRAAPQFGSRFTTGDPDYNNLSLWQHWAQRCFVGGIDAELYADDAMYDDGVGVNTTEHEKVTLARDLARGGGSNWTVASGTGAAASGFKAVVYDSKLYVLTLATLPTESQLWRYDASGDGWTRITSLDGKNITARNVCVFDGKLFISGADSVSGNPKIVYDDGALTSWTTQANPAGVGTADVRAMKVFQQKMYVSYGNQIWRMKNDQTWDGNTVFYKTNSLSDSNYINSMEVHLGFLYMLSKNGHIHRTDGNSTFDIWNWDGQTEGVAIRSFDGRLFVLTFEWSDTDVNVGYGVLYQMSGSAVTMLKRWGKDGEATRIGNMTVYDRKMFYGASNLLGLRAGFGVAVYDPIEDAHSIIANNVDTVTYARGAAPYMNYMVDDQIFFNGDLFVFVRGHGAFKTPFKYRDSTRGFSRFDTSATALGSGSMNGGWFTTSTYDAGTPGLRKLFRKISVDHTLPSANQSIIVDYSTDGGATWDQAGICSTVGTRLRSEFHIENVSGVSIKLRFTLRSSVATQTPVMLGFMVSYVPIPEPNWLWTFTIVLAERVQYADETGEQVYDTEAEQTFLRNLYRTKAMVTYTDLDGSLWATGGEPGVIIYDIEFRPYDLTQPLEAEVVVTLLEAVETY